METSVQLFLLSSSLPSRYSSSKRFKPKLFTGLLALFFTLFLPGLSIAQSCIGSPAEFDVTFVNDNTCIVVFTPKYTPGNKELVTHFWDFGDGSSSNAPIPTHSFPIPPTTTVFTVTHTITILDQTTMVLTTYTCSQNVTISPDKCPLCPLYPEQGGTLFDYDAHGCTVDFDAASFVCVGPNCIYHWEFDDGSLGVTTSSLSVTHTFPGSGTYKVTLAYTSDNPDESFRCQRYVTVYCEETCCDFTYTGGDCNNCLEYDFHWDNPCELSDAHHVWYIDGVLVSTVPNPSLHLTDINTCEDPQVVITHVVNYGATNCMASQVINFAGKEGIYIGTGAGNHSNLSSYTKLPGSTYGGSCPVYVCGLIDVDKDFAFQGTEILAFPGDVGFDVQATFELMFDHATHAHAACECLWRGIRLRSSGDFTSRLSTIEDAAYAVWGDGKNIISLDHTYFYNNYIGVRADASVALPAFLNNEFATTRPLYSNCGLGLDFLPSVGYQTGRSYIGMRFNKANLTLLGTMGSPTSNLFYQIGIGLEILNSVATIEDCCSFYDIDCTAYGVAGGFGTRFWDCSDFTERFNLFSNVSTGIRGNVGTGVTTVADIAANRMNTVGIGVELHAVGGRMTGEVHSNEIDVAPVDCEGGAYGIGFEDNATAVHDLRIDDNTISVDYPGSSSFGIWLFGNNTTSNQLPFEVEVDNNNSINIIDGTGGIQLDNFRGAYVHDNVNIHIDAGPAFLLAGIHDQNGNNNILCGNSIINNTMGNSSYGIRVNNTQDNIIRHNGTVDSDFGVTFNANCGTMTDFGCNIFDGTQNIGLWYDNTSGTGTQSNKGNLWNTNTFTFKALGQNFTFANSRYFVRNIAVENPANPSTAQVNPYSVLGVLWFTTNQTNAPECADECDAHLKLMELTDGDKARAQGDDEFEQYGDLLNWLGRNYLYNKLLAMSPADITDPVFQNFLDAQSGTPLAQLHTVEAQTHALLTLTDAESAGLNANQDAVNAAAAELDTLQQAMQTLDQQTDAYQQARAAWEAQAAELDDLLAARAALRQAIATRWADGATAILETNDAIESGAAWENNERFVWDVYLHTIVRGDALSDGARAELSALAATCFFDGGPAVYRAHSLYYALTGTQAPTANCDAQERTRNERTTSASALPALLVVPNPSRGEFQITLPTAEGGEILIYNQLGLVAQRIIVASGQQKATAALPSGVYRVAFKGPATTTAARLIFVF